MAKHLPMPCSTVDIINFIRKYLNFGKINKNESVKLNCNLILKYERSN